MLACLDVDYRAGEAVAACLLFADWMDAVGSEEWVMHLPPAAPYEPGRFYLRELPCLLAVLGRASHPPSTVIIDGYVFLDAEGRPGLGAHLYDALNDALGRRIPIIGVAKRAFAGAPFAVAVQRGASKAPLYVTAIGLPPEEAAERIKKMHGPHRVPTLLKRVDRLCRDG